MNTTFFTSEREIFLVQSKAPLSDTAKERLAWLLQANPQSEDNVQVNAVGPRKEIVSPWSTNATEIAQSAGIDDVVRIERFVQVDGRGACHYDRMTEAFYESLSNDTLALDRKPQPLVEVDSIEDYNQSAGLALSAEEVDYLENVVATLGRKLTDAELYAFSQINSEHCRHKIFNGEFVIDGETKPESLFSLIKQTSKVSPDYLVSAYKDNVAFIKGPMLTHFAPEKGEEPSEYDTTEFESVLSLKAETHNFPTTVEPFYGASTGGGGEIRDRMAGGMGSFPLAGTAVYMTSYPRLSASRAEAWERFEKERNWKYQSPSEILIKASNGASDFGNKFGQPLICGSLLTFEGRLASRLYAYDRCIMLAGGVGFAKAEHAQKGHAAVGDVVVVLGGDNYRIGMAGGSVSSVDTGSLSEELELSAVQRANPEMQKRVYNAIRSLCEMSSNPIKLIHDHGAGGHVNCLSELLEEVGGRISIDALPVGDPTLSPLELICNESQERMGLLLSAADVPLLREICERERAPMYVVGEVTGDGKIVFATEAGEAALDLPLEVLFGSSPKTVLEDETESLQNDTVEHRIDTADAFQESLELVLSLEAVASKDWLTNKVDRCVTGLVAQQQCVGPLQLPLSDYACMSLDYTGEHGVATAIGHASVVGLIDPVAGATQSVVESLTNLAFAPLAYDLGSVVLSANWMWPAKQSGENARLYSAVAALSEFCQSIGVAVPTGKDSLSMTMKYDDGSSVRAPGTVIVSSMAETRSVTSGVTPALASEPGTQLLYLDCSGEAGFPLGASAFAQTRATLGNAVAQVSAEYFVNAFGFIQELVKEGVVLAGHDVSAGGLITSICEMAFAGNAGVAVSLSKSSRIAIDQLFSEKPAVVMQVRDDAAAGILERAASAGLRAEKIAEVTGGTQLRVTTADWEHTIDLATLRRVWMKPSFLLDSKQTKRELAKERYDTFDKHPLEYQFPEAFDGSRNALGVSLSKPLDSAAPIAAVVRDKGTNGEREMAVCLQIAGFRVRDVTTSDLTSGRETLSDVSFVVFPGGFSNSDVLGAGRGWAGSLLYNETAKATLDAFFARKDTMSLGVCNGCQLVSHLGILDTNDSVEMRHNESGKFESAFVGVQIKDSQSIMLEPLVGSTLGVWVAHGEGNFHFKNADMSCEVAMTYRSSDYPANPNGSERNAAAVSSADGRHLVMMPHLERSMFAWSWPYRGGVAPFEVSPWILAFRAASEWCKQHRKE